LVLVVTIELILALALHLRDFMFGKAANVNQYPRPLEAVMPPPEVSPLFLNVACGYIGVSLRQVAQYADVFRLLHQPISPHLSVAKLKTVYAEEGSMFKCRTSR
jgi:hypothetical protein